MTFGGYEIGRPYNRRADIHERFNGQRQGGISTPAGLPVIFLFTGDSGTQHGYSDGWEDGVFHYFGEGQAGPMQWRAGNLAIRDHAANGKDLLIFETGKKGKPVRFIGQFSCAGFRYQDAPDRAGNIRQAIVFELVPEGQSGAGKSPIESEEPTTGESLESLRKKARAASSPKPAKSSKEAMRSYVERSEAVRMYVLTRAKGVCENCENPAPFITPKGMPYLEPHHIRRLSDGGPDDPRFMAGICPNCHRQAHSGADAKALNDQLLAKIFEIELSLD